MRAPDTLPSGLREVCGFFPVVRPWRPGNIPMADAGMAEFSRFFMRASRFCSIGGAWIAAATDPGHTGTAVLEQLQHGVEDLMQIYRARCGHIRLRALSPQQDHHHSNMDRKQAPRTHMPSPATRSDDSKNI